MATSPNIKGLNLEIDPSIQKICEVSNATSSSTRSVLYILVIVSILSLIAVLNTRKNNWSNSRIHNFQDSIRTQREDTIKTNFFRSAETALIRNKVENSQTVRIPILGNTFDVNDLNIVAGVTFLILLFILRFTIMREINNLKIALQAISERYPDCANKHSFKSYISSHNPEKKTTIEENILGQINFVRRKHHYNFLSMNEIFTLPPLEIDEGLKINRFFYWLINHIYWLPSIVYFCILLNDISTLKIGLEINTSNTIIGLGVGMICTTFIAFVCHRCSNQKKILNELYKHFSKSGYKYEKQEFSYSVSVPWFVVAIKLMILAFVAFQSGVFQN